MGSRWTKEDYNNLYRVRNERVPAVCQASRSLHSAIGIAVGTKMIGEAPVMLWELPEPPKQTTQEMFASLRTRMGLGNNKPVDQAVNKTEDVEDDRDRDRVTSEDNEGAYVLPWHSPQYDRVNGD